MKTPLKKMNTVVIVVLYLLAIVFFAYGIYMVMYSIGYVQSYQSGTSVAAENAIQYVVTSSIAYFGFGIMILIGAIALSTINRLQINIYESILTNESQAYEQKPSIYDGEQMALSVDELALEAENHKNPYYSERNNNVIDNTEPKYDSDYEPDEAIIDEPPRKTRKELKAEKKEIKLKEKEEKAAREKAEAEAKQREDEIRASKEREAAEKREAEDAEAERLEREREMAEEAERSKRAAKAAEAERLRKEAEAIKTEHLQHKSKATKAVKKEMPEDDFEIEAFTLNDISSGSPSNQNDRNADKSSDENTDEVKQNVLSEESTDNADTKISSSVIKNILENK